MSLAVFRVVLLVSCAHAMVHVYELALPSVEQNIGAEYGVDREETGVLGTAFRVPWGFGAFFAGWLADRFGSKPMLVVYLLGCAAVSIGVWLADEFSMLFVTMFLLGSFASIYHPAGLAIISREAPVEARGRALGWHGIFGSLGIAIAPFLAWFWLGLGYSWREYFLLIAVPGAALAVALLFTLSERRSAETHAIGAARNSGCDTQAEAFRLLPFFVLMSVAVLSGLIYSAFMHFLPRYLSGSGMRPSWGCDDVRFAKLVAALVLGCGMLGQSIGGRLARPASLVPMLALVLLGNAPLLLWMAYATGPSRVFAACLLGFVHFMYQPIYNSLVAHAVPIRRRSLGYGFSNMVAFGLGGFGPTLAGFLATDEATYATLATVAVLAACVSLVMCVPAASPSTTVR
jgi:MFS family permease